MSTHNISFCREIRKILYGCPLLSVATCMTAIDKMGYQVNIFSYISTKTYVHII